MPILKKLFCFPCDRLKIVATPLRRMTMWYLRFSFIPYSLVLTRASNSAFTGYDSIQKMAHFLAEVDSGFAGKSMEAAEIYKRFIVII